MKGDILDRECLEEVFSKDSFSCCIHFAGLKAVGESVEKPWEYYHNNIAGTLILTDVMRKHGCKNIIFSSSATVYGEPAEIPITENCPKAPCASRKVTSVSTSTVAVSVRQPCGVPSASR